jgi:hypothetical protein
MMPTISIAACITHAVTGGKKQTTKCVITDIVRLQDITRTLWRVARQDATGHRQRSGPKEPSGVYCLTSSSQMGISGIQATFTMLGSVHKQQSHSACTW